MKIVKGMRLRCIIWWLAFFCFWVTGECQWLHLELIKEMRIFCKTLFPVVEYAYSTIPTYPSGQIGFMLCSKDPVSVLHSTAVSHSSVATLCGRSQLCGWFGIAITETFLLFRKQISRNQQRHSQKKKLKQWTLNITTQKFTEPRSSCLNLPKRYF